MEDLLQMLDEMEAALPEWREKIALLRKQVMGMDQRLQWLLRQMFGSKSEKTDPAQLMLAFAQCAEAAPLAAEVPAPPAVTPVPRKASAPRAPRVPEHLPERRVVIDPPEVKADPDAYVYIGSETREKLDYEPPKWLRLVIERRKYVRKDDRSLPPVLAPAEPELISNGYASVNLLVHILVAKFVDHLPLYRQSDIFARQGIILSRKTLCDWMAHTGNWMEAVVREMRKEIRGNGYVQVDETEVRYLKPGAGKAPRGQLWVFHAPGAGVVFEWHNGHGASCMEQMFSGYQGWAQCDGHSSHESFAKRAEASEISWAGCWAHARRKFHEARGDSYFARWMLHQIGLLYAVERRVKNLGPALREAARAAESRMILHRIFRALRQQMRKAENLPKTLTGKAIGYALPRQEVLRAYVRDGRVHIDNNGVENAIRPTALGRKNWLFYGSEEAGQHNAALLSVVQSCRMLGVPLEAYLTELLEALPRLTQQDVAEWTPARWLARREKQEAA